MTEQNHVDLPLMLCVFNKADNPENQITSPLQVFNLRLDKKFISDAGLVDITTFVTHSFKEAQEKYKENEVRVLMCVESDKWKMATETK